ncbi:MAG: 4Fe-4S dicluster domain-containing protein [Candidatus Methanomethylicia archaeon]|nr:4Fe-4S dicluster domain-containing protein [Candidatus Methanomethylicia archaeon]
MAMTVAIAQEKKPLIKFDLQKCAFCKICELSCSDFHYKKFGDAISRITIVRKGPTMFRYFICTRCDKRFCIPACPTKALSYVGGNIVVDEKLCNSCGDCVKACPFHGIKLHPITKMPLICDLCNGDPNCVKACPKSALTLVWLPEARK